MTILHLEGDPTDAARARHVLATGWPGCRFTIVTAPDEYTAALAAPGCDLIIADCDVHSWNGRASMRLAREAWPGTPFVVLLGPTDEQHAIDLLREGAWDYVLKDRLDRLLTVVPRVLRESTERRSRLQAEKKLRQSEERFHAIFLSVAEGVIVLDENGVIVSANPSAARILGLTVNKLIGRSGTAGWHFVREDLLPMSAEDLPAMVALRTGQPQPGVVVGIRQPDGALVWASTQAQPLTPAGEHQPTGVVVTFHDITGQKQLQEQFFRAQRLESLGLLAAGIAHDMNNFLSPVLMGAPLLRDRAVTERDRKILEAMEKSAQRGARLVQQIRRFTRGTSGEHRPVQVQQLVRDLAGLLEASLPKSIRVVIEQDPDLWLTLADPSQLNQVLLNLCVNARDAMSDGGTLRIVARNHQLELRPALALGAMPPGPYLRIEVVDTGTGIPPDVLPYIWEPFFTTKGADKGTGLGLSTVRGIVQSHHGHIEVESKIGVGTTFRILLPASTDPSTEASSTGVSTSPYSLDRGKGELVLVVDDEEHIRELATTLLAQQGYRVLAVTDGMQACSQLLQRGEEIRVMVTDLSMPELDGYGLALITRRQYPTIKILAISGKISSAGLSEDFFRHTDGFLYKPFKPRALFEAVQKLLANVAPLHEAHRADCGGG